MVLIRNQIKNNQSFIYAKLEEDVIDYGKRWGYEMMNEEYRKLV